MRTGGALRLWIGLSALAAAGGFLACQKPSQPPAATVIPSAQTDATSSFDDVTADSGIDFTYRNGEEANRYTILESLGGGVALLDYDGDGLLDVFVTGGGY